MSRLRDWAELVALGLMALVLVLLGVLVALVPLLLGASIPLGIAALLFAAAYWVWRQV